jgi:putative membrane protein
VKDFANHMITDHGKADDELKPIAQEMNVTLPQKVSAEHRLRNESGNRGVEATVARARMKISARKILGAAE